jgi:adenylate kinase
LAVRLDRGFCITDRNVVVITGTPGVGKSTVARRIADRTGFRLIQLNLLAEEVGGIGGADHERETQIIKPGVIRRALRKILKKSEGTVIIEGHYGELVPSEFVRVAVVLRTDPLKLGERLRSRGYPEAKVKENVEAELLDCCLIDALEAFGEARVVEVDTTELETEGAVREVEGIVRGKGGKPPGSINWIAKLEGEGKIKDLLR